MDSNLVCRTCLQMNTPKTCKIIEEMETNSDIMEMLSYCIPEMVSIKNKIKNVLMQSFLRI